MDSTHTTKGGGSRRPSGDPAVVALRMEDLTRWVIQRVAKMPREHRFTIGDRLVETSLELSAWHPARCSRACQRRVASWCRLGGAAVDSGVQSHGPPR